ncbi:unnamed protein product [Prunus armeniaca]|uniref:Uncharacterized protein n=1 Tax=Prunus armeniaca TaxID=36596 RepID=A0A6J5TKG0_PRUAR|nr:unnamed protein product [Prunus armeniaca]
MKLQKREASEVSKRADSGSAQEGAYRPQINVSNAQSSGKPPAAGNILKAAESALNLEQGRLQKLKQFDDENQALRLRSKEKYERQISKLVQQITGTKDSVRGLGTCIMPYEFSPEGTLKSGQA